MSMSKEEARKLTEQIRDNISQSARLVQKAHAEKIWTTLGISSFQEWLSQSLGLSRARGYQLLNIAKTEEQISKLLTLPEFFILSDRQTRTITKLGVDKFVERLAKTREENDLEDDAEDNLILIMDVCNELDKEFEANNIANKQPREEPQPEPNKYAESFYTQFLYQINDLPGADTIEPMDYKMIIEELENTLANIDENLNSYLLIEDN